MRVAEERRPVQGLATENGFGGAAFDDDDHSEKVGAMGYFDAASLQHVGETLRNDHQISDLDKFVQRAQDFAHHMMDYLGDIPPSAILLVPTAGRVLSN